MIFRAMSGNGLKRQSIRFRAFRCILFMMILVPRPLMDGIILLKVAPGFQQAMKPCTAHVMLLDGISFNTLASAMSPLIKPCNSFLHSMKVTSWCLNIWSFSTAPNTLASPILPKHWCSWRSRISGKLHVKVLWILAVLLAAPALNWHTILIRSPVWIFLHALFSKPSFWPKVTESVISSPQKVN